MIATAAQTDREKVLAWLASIKETDPAMIAFVIGQCVNDKEARAYYLACAKKELTLI